MQVLYITTELPLPLVTGFQRHYHFLRALSARHEITYLSLTRRRDVEPEVLDELRRLVHEVQVFGTLGQQPRAIAMLSRLPWFGARFGRGLRLRAAARNMKRVSDRLRRERQFDLLFFSGKDTYPALAGVRDLPIVADCCDATSVRVRGEMRYATPARKLRLLLRYMEVRPIERAIVRTTRHLAFASERDRCAMLGDRQGGVIVPQAVDLEHWTRRAPFAPGKRVVFAGDMGYPPNHDAAVRLVEHVLPAVRAAVPEVQVLIVGRDPGPRLLAAARAAGVIVTGEPVDMRDYVEMATVCCAPLRFASGMQFKILEAMAMQVPVVTTTVAAEGLCIGGQTPPLIVADDSAAMSSALASLLQSPAERRRLGDAGRRYVAEHFTWSASVDKLLALVARAVGESSGTALPNLESLPRWRSNGMARPPLVEVGLKPASVLPASRGARWRRRGLESRPRGLG